MSSNLVLQSYPPVDGANAYVTAAIFLAYCATNGYTVPTVPTADTALIEAAIIRATKYLDLRHRYVGYRYAPRQPTEWPRQNAWDDRNDIVTGVPQQVLDATCEYALRALTAELLPDPEVDASGKSVTKALDKAGGVETERQYDKSAQYMLPTYPFADLMLRQRGLLRPDGSGGIRSGRTVLA